MAEKPRKQTGKQELHVQIKSLRRLSLQLNSLSEELNQTVQTVEHFLNVTCSLGIPTCVHVEYDSVEQHEFRTSLGYLRVGGKFRIAVVETTEAGEENVRPWSDCPRDEKFKTFQKLPELLATLTEVIEERIKEALEARQAIKPILEEIKPILEEMGEEAVRNADDDIPF